MMTVKDKILALLLVLAFNAFAAAWTGSNSEPENMKKIDGKPFYVITTADELAWFAAQVNAGQTSINAVLGNDVVFGENTSSLNSKNWTPIGKDSTKMFSGIFDGASYTIYGLYSHQRRISGLFGVIGENAVVKNITMASSKVRIDSNNGSAGSIAGVNNGLVTNCINRGLVEIPIRFGSSGGIVGSAGGIVGSNSGRIKYSKNQNTLTYDNGGDTVQVSQFHFGGICGFNKGEISKSENNGAITLKIKIVTNFFMESRVRLIGAVAGIVGWNEGTISLSKNLKAISASFTRTDQYSYNGTSTYAGGIVAANYGQIKNCFNTGTYSAIRQETISKEVPGTVGGVSAVNNGTGSVKTSFDVQSLNYYLNKSAVSSTSENMQKDQFAWILNTTNGAEENSGVWTRGSEGYPTFANEDSLAICKIVFNDDGVTSNRYTNYKGVVSFPENPEPAERLVFSGWFNADDIRVKPTTVFVADQTVNAVYVDASNVFWTINFYNAAPADTLLESKTYQHGSIVTYGGETPIKEQTAQYSYTFKGWDVDPTNAFEDFNYHAVYDSTIRSYTIVFNNYDGTEIESGTYEYGKTPACSVIPTRAATAEWTYSHKGWNPAVDVVTGPATYTATFDSSKVEYKVTFMNGTAVIDEQMVPYGDAAVAPTNVSREGYKFVGWNTSFAKVTENLTVKALFEELPTYFVKIVDDGGVKIDSVNVKEGGVYFLPEPETREGYAFAGYFNEGMGFILAGEGITVTADIEITAFYAEIPKSSSSSTPKSSSSSISSSSAKSSSSSAKSSSSVRSSSSSSKLSSSSAKTSIVMQNSMPKFRVSVNSRGIQLSGAEVGTAYVLLDMQGRVLQRGCIVSASFNIAVPNVGQYFVKVGNQVRNVRVK